MKGERGRIEVAAGIETGATRMVDILDEAAIVTKTETALDETTGREYLLYSNQKLAVEGCLRCGMILTLISCLGLPTVQRAMNMWNSQHNHAEN